MSIIWLILAVLCFVYYIVCISYAGIGTAFAFVWAVAAGIFALLSVLCRLSEKGIWLIPGWLKILFFAVAAMGLVTFIILEACIVSGMYAVPEEKCDYVIVLGAQVRGTRVSKSLARRLDAAYAYYQNNPETIIIVSGGQGKGEDISEAEAMKRYLVEKGVPEEKILKEDRSADTNENLRFSLELMEKENPKVAIATNDFHIFRAIHLAKGKGLENVSGIPAPSDEILFINYMVREAVGVLKDFLFGHF